MFPMVQTATLAFFVVAITLVISEVVFSQLYGMRLYKLKDTLCNLAIMVVNKFGHVLFFGYIYGSLRMIEQFKIFNIPDNLFTTLLAVVLTDMMYYFEHRFSHKLRVLWFFHEVHHSSKSFNFSTSFRLHWLARLTSPLVFGPLVLLGFKPEQVVLFFLVNLFYQFMLHTKTVGKLGSLEGIINTPSAHRVHHARNRQYIDKNFGGILLIWDRLFGTYEPETVEPVFGVLGKFESNNPVVVQFHRVPGFMWAAGKIRPVLNAVQKRLPVKPALSSD